MTYYSGAIYCEVILIIVIIIIIIIVVLVIIVITTTTTTIIIMSYNYLYSSSKPVLCSRDLWLLRPHPGGQRAVDSKQIPLSIIYYAKFGNTKIESLLSMSCPHDWESDSTHKKFSCSHNESSCQILLHHFKSENFYYTFLSLRNTLK